VAKVAVVVPTLGTRPDWLAVSLKAIASQERADIELVVVHPPGVDVKWIANAYGARLEVERKRGLASAINQGAESAGRDVEYVTWIADDDVLAPKSIMRSAFALEEHAAAPFSFGRVRYLDEYGCSKWLLRTGVWVVNYAKYGVNFIPQPGSLVRRSAWTEVGGLDESFSNAMDHDLFLRLAILGRPVYLPHEVAGFRVHPGSISVLKDGQDESDQIRTRFGRSRVPAKLARISDKLLLSALRRVPGPSMPTIDGIPYTLYGADEGF